MPGDDLLFQRLSVSTIGAVWFHGRVRDGIGWGTDAMVTRQWSRRNTGFDAICFRCLWLGDRPPSDSQTTWANLVVAELLVMVGILQA